MFYKKLGALGIAGVKGKAPTFRWMPKDPKVSGGQKISLEGDIKSVVIIAPVERPVSGWRLRSKSLKSRSHQHPPG
jgi:hypothetical protein